MFFARATCECSEFGLIEVAICSDVETEQKYSEMDTETVFHVKYDRPIADEILRAAAKNIIPISFECNGVLYVLKKYSINDEERIYNRYRKNHIDRITTVQPLSSIFVYSQRCRCRACYIRYGFDNIQNICAYVPLETEKNKLVPIDMQICTRCNKYFIDAQSLSQYEKKYGKLSLREHRITGNESENDYYKEWFFNPDSILSRNGYSTGLSDVERKQILINMMENNISKAEIKDKLSDFIYYRSYRNPRASEVWKADLEFVNDYKLGSEPIVYFK